MTSSVPFQRASDDLLRVAVAAYLARYKSLSRAHTDSDLQMFLRWCAEHDLDPFAARRVDVELFVRWLRNPTKRHGCDALAPAPQSTKKQVRR